MSQHIIYNELNFYTSYNTKLQIAIIIRSFNMGVIHILNNHILKLANHKNHDNLTSLPLLTITLYIYDPFKAPKDMCCKYQAHLVIKKENKYFLYNVFETNI